MSSEFSDVFRKLGQKETPKRRAILAVLAGSPIFLSPEEVWKTLKGRFATIGLPTVYRNLEELARGGIITTVIHPNRQLYYYYCAGMTGHHHHFICTSCRKVIDIPFCAVEAMEEEVKSRTDGRVVSHIIQLNGLCGACSAVP